jgi:histidinol dehydrogenase
VPLVRRDPTTWLASRANGRTDDVRADVARIVRDVQERGDRAVMEWTEKLDGVRLESWRLSPDASKAALDGLNAGLFEALDVARRRIRAFHEATRPPSVLEAPVSDGIAARLIREPLRRVAVYVPAGRWPLPSSLLMGVIPAQVAGVAEICVLTPPRRLAQASAGDLPAAWADPVTLAAAALVGVTEIYLVGGAQALAAAAFGTETLPRVDKVVGPGNRWVTEAKRQLHGVVGIDGLNGPSEVVIWAEPPASPTQVALDLLAQAEHDPASWALVLSSDEALLAEIDRAVAQLDGQDLLRQPGVGAVRVSDAEEAVQFVQQFAPEHLELWGAAEAFHDRLDRAGATFIGCPTPLGDYLAGPNHVLPTGGTARFASVLGVDDFLRRRTETRVVGTTGPVAGLGARLARAEGLLRHGAALDHFAEATVHG